MCIRDRYQRRVREARPPPPNHWGFAVNIGLVGLFYTEFFLFKKYPLVRNVTMSLTAPVLGLSLYISISFFEKTSSLKRKLPKTFNLGKQNRFCGSTSTL
eukprot:TRINITY_DN5622_c0_g1_i1.p1 TRINITY_DN5622_c0_g1~~TRINITY_DN5622_c0_g1_i1.p1  ORF type:complete len:100 (-),score=15.03 TRINITY_DN5622_c0_g1_i1:75-374(-)